MKNSKLIQVAPDCRRAESWVPGDRGLRGPREPGYAHQMQLLYQNQGNVLQMTIEDGL